MEVASFEDEWNQLLLKDVGFITAYLTYDETDDCSVFRQDLSVDLIPNIETPTGFIETSQSTVSSDVGISSFSSSLTLSMAITAGRILDEEMGSIKTSSDMDPVPNKRRLIVSSDRELLSPPPPPLPLSVAMAAGYILDKDLNINVEEDDHNRLKSTWSSVPAGGPLAEALRPCLPFWGSNPVE